VGRLTDAVSNAARMAKVERRETVWKVLSGCEGGLRSALWRAGDTLRICPTTNGVASARICLAPQGEDAPGFTAYGRSSTPSSTCSRAAARGGSCPELRTPWKTVYDWFRRWRIDGTWERLNTELRERLRWRLGRDPNPSAGIVDSQSARTTGVGVLGLSVEVVRKPQKPLPEKVAKIWAEEWAKEGKEVDWQRLMPPRGFRVLPRR